MTGKSHSCKGAADTLKRCLRDSECGRTTNKTLRECAAIADECKPFRTAYFICRREQLDMRSRIQGMKGAGWSNLRSLINWRLLISTYATYLYYMYNLQYMYIIFHTEHNNVYIWTVRSFSSCMFRFANAKLKYRAVGKKYFKTAHLSRVDTIFFNISRYFDNIFYLGDRVWDTGCKRRSITIYVGFPSWFSFRYEALM